MSRHPGREHLRCPSTHARHDPHVLPCSYLWYRLSSSRPQWLVWHEPFSQADGAPDDFFRFTSAAARSIAEDAQLHVQMVRTDGSYAAVVCDTLDLKPSDHEACNQATGEPWRTEGGFYLATAMLARLQAPTLVARLQAAMARG
mmetsp:Transcript_24584/g.62742  ORF Transcript_24584/g.62742 Transcript_24584/m.62742 type:complete len:144 (-) Transcript_24584:38-469(-)